MQSVRLMPLIFAQLIYVAELEKMAVNDHLLVFYQSENSAPRYQCLSSVSQAVNEVKLTLAQSHLHSVAIGKRQTESQMYFVAFGTMGKYEANYIFYMTKVTVHCNGSQSNQDTVFFDNTTFHETFSRVFDVSPDGRFALSCTDESLLIFDLNTLQNSSHKIFDWSNRFRPMTLKISDRHVFIAGYSEKAMNLSRLYLLNLTTDYNVSIDDVRTAEKNDDRLRIFSLSVTDDGDDVTPRILLALTQPDVIYLLAVNESGQLQSISSKTPLKAFGVAWLNQGQKAVVRTSDNVLFVYNMGKDMKFNNSTARSSVFPNGDQTFPPKFSNVLWSVQSSFKSDALYLLNDKGQVLVLPPSQPGYYSVPNLFGTSGLVVSFISDIAQCRTGTYKNDTGLWPCNPCQATRNTSSLDLIDRTCPQCTKKEFCPGEFTMPIHQFEDVQQNQDYPESPEIDVFDDLILYNIFRIDCGITSPFFLTLICLAIILVFSILIYLMKMVKRLQTKQKNLHMLCRHLDLIGQGQLWFGGLVSMSLLCIAVFASQFSHNFHLRYPLEKQHLYTSSKNGCKATGLLNSKFETSLQFLSRPSQEYEQIVGLLNSQSFTFRLDVLQTQFHCAQLRLHYLAKNVYLPFSCHQKGANLHISASLPVHEMTFNVMLYGNHSIDSVRFGLTAEQLESAANVAQELHFAKRFNSSGHRLSQNALVGIDLTKVINVTEGLAEGDQTLLSGLWFPTFTFDVDQIFINSSTPLARLTDPGMHPHAYLTTLSIAIKETVFFVKNKQEPIARRSEIIFHTILFVSLCIDLVAMGFLLLKLWLIPLMKLLLRKVLRPTNWLYGFIFERVVYEAKKSSPDLVRLEKELNALKVKLQESNDIMQAFIRSISVIHRPTLDSVSC